MVNIMMIYFQRLYNRDIIVKSILFTSKKGMVINVFPSCESHYFGESETFDKYLITTRDRLKVNKNISDNIKIVLVDWRS